VVRRAIISDIHANLEALAAVLSDIQSFGCEEIYCLGDTVGYGPNPCECLDLTRGLTASLLGNHDLAALFDPEGFSTMAEQAIFWTRRQLETCGGPGPSQERMAFLAHLPRTIQLERILMVHASVRNPVSEYVFPEDVFNTRKMEKLFSLVDLVAFQGHTHVPGVFTETGHFLRPNQLEDGFDLGSGKIMVNVGSVGQPRDGDWRSCYVLLEDYPGPQARVQFRRVEYDVDQTIAKIKAIEPLDNFLADRLREGR
jgi:diadenosine tetraphosphatase ApaH/serine/threonine PP2A family protein phosphatase